MNQNKSTSNYQSNGKNYEMAYSESVPSGAASSGATYGSYPDTEMATVSTYYTPQTSSQSQTGLPGDKLSEIGYGKDPPRTGKYYLLLDPCISLRIAAFICEDPYIKNFL